MKQIDIQLLEHLQGHATTWCYIMRVASVGKWHGTVRGFSGLDESFEYDDGQGPVFYMADNGFMPAKFQGTADFSVDNSDVVGWVNDEEITDADILAGIFTSAEVTIYRVNYMNLAAGHEVVDFGSFGETQLIGNKWRCEFRSLMQKAKQPTGEVYSLTCRNQYGDALCKKPFEWVSGTVTAQGTNNLLDFTASGLGQAEGYFAPGVIEWLTGDNAGADMDVDDFAVGGIVRLALAMPMPIKVGDTFRIRQDCDKTFETCQARGNYLEFNGEHLTPVGDTGLAVPGAYIVQQGAST